MIPETHVGATILSPADLAAFGLNELAYVRPHTLQGVDAFAIHGADGSRLAVVPTEEIAVAVILQNDLVPVTLH